MAYQNQVLEGVQGRIKSRLDNDLLMDSQNRAAQAQGLHKVIWDPDATDEARERAVASLEKLYPQNKDLLGKIRETTGKVFGFLKAPPATREGAQKQSEQVLSQATGQGGATSPAGQLPPTQSATVAGQQVQTGTAPYLPPPPAVTATAPSAQQQPVQQPVQQPTAQPDPMAVPQTNETYAGLLTPPPASTSSPAVAATPAPTQAAATPGRAALAAPPTFAQDVGQTLRTGLARKSKEEIEKENRAAANTRETKRQELTQTHQNTLTEQAALQGSLKEREALNTQFWDVEPTIGMMFNKHTGEQKPLSVALQAKLVNMQHQPGLYQKEEDFAWGDPKTGRWYKVGPNDQLIDISRDFKPFPPGAGNAAGYMTIQTVDDQGNPITRVLPRAQAGAIGAFNAAPTADARNKEAGKGLFRSGVEEVRALSTKLITERTRLEQAAKGAGMAFESYIGENPEYITYQAARKAAAANLAIATQGSRPSDTDVIQVWLPMIPDVFRDTDQSTKQKWDLTFSLAGLNPGQTFLPPPPGITVGGEKKGDTGPERTPATGAGGAGAGSVTVPYQGKNIRFPNKAAADAFKKEMKIQ